MLAPQTYADRPGLVEDVELVADLHWIVIDPLVRLIGVEVCHPIVVELHFLGEGGSAQTHECCEIDEFHFVAPLWS
jgi:hypothetical protein